MLALRRNLTLNVNEMWKVPFSILRSLEHGILAINAKLEQAEVAFMTKWKHLAEIICRLTAVG